MRTISRRLKLRSSPLEGAAGGKITTIEGDPPKSRVVIQQWDSLENFQAAPYSAVAGPLCPRQAPAFLLVVMAAFHPNAVFTLVGTRRRLR